MAELISVRDRRIGADDRGPYRHIPDAPPSCPSCGSSNVESAQTVENRLVQVCLNPRCSTWTVFRRVEGRWLVADRIPRERRRAIQDGRLAIAEASAG
jgi:hypothetical protein